MYEPEEYLLPETDEPSPPNELRTLGDIARALFKTERRRDFRIRIEGDTHYPWLYDVPKPEPGPSGAYWTLDRFRRVYIVIDDVIFFQRYTNQIDSWRWTEYKEGKIVGSDWNTVDSYSPGKPTLLDNALDELMMVVEAPAEGFDTPGETTEVHTDAAEEVPDTDHCGCHGSSCPV